MYLDKFQYTVHMSADGPMVLPRTFADLFYEIKYNNGGGWAIPVPY
jgi:hypothetical protein